MRAATLTAFAGIDAVTVQDVPEPRLGRDEVLIQVRTVGANQLDLNTISGLGPGARTPLPLVLGIDPAGVVVAQGAGVTDRLGEHVVVKPNVSCGRCRWCLDGREADCPDQPIIGVHRHGGAAELVAVPARNAFPLHGLGFSEATAAVHSVPIALHAIGAAGGVEAGQTVLVTGVTGAVGWAAVHLARHAGARVLAASTSRTLDIPGVVAVPYDSPESLVEHVLEIVPNGVDLAVDGTGHGGVQSAAVRSLSWCGRLAICSASLATELSVDARALYLRRQRIIGAASADYLEVTAALDLVRAGVVPAPVGPRFTLGQVREAYRAIGDRNRSGKVVIDVS
jgi:NADPH:quinone reductase-like Zn-dependent oxidoreductase